MEATDSPGASEGQQPAITLFTRLRGIAVRISIAAVLIAACCYASLSAADQFYVTSIGGEVRFFSVLGILAIVRFVWMWLKIKSIPLAGAIFIVLVPVMVFGLDRMPYTPEDMDIRFLSMVGILLFQHPLSLILARFYRAQAARTRRRIDRKLSAIRSAES